MSVQVVHVQRKDAKRVKTRLEDLHVINKDYRIAPSVDRTGCVAIPILETGIDWSSVEGVLGLGYQEAPYSSMVLGNPGKKSQRNNQLLGETSWNASQTCLYTALSQCSTLKDQPKYLKSLVSSLTLSSCPRSFEYFGDDRTLVVPPLALNPHHDESLLQVIEACEIDLSDAWLSTLWELLASHFKSPRIVRRGAIDPDSGIRHSGFRLLWPCAGIPDTTGPGSPGWITVTEQGIRQSFDLTRVMFSRGNISEKIRFGQLVEEGENVLDLYGGIGYFTLPALVHGRASHVTVCEWNPDAVAALKFNLADNEVGHRATVLEGDCRYQKLSPIFDRVSLGLLPSSEGGWRTAVRALRRTEHDAREGGGWLHIHGNVPVYEVGSWSCWVCMQLRKLVNKELAFSEWVIVANHVEKVKSFAPTINHYVIDIYVGPLEQWTRFNATGKLVQGGTAVVGGDGTIALCASEISAPSCALSSTGAIHQEWMREKE